MVVVMVAVAGVAAEELVEFAVPPGALADPTTMGSVFASLVAVVAIVVLVISLARGIVVVVLCP